MENKTQKHYKMGIVIGRFQPFHKGHKYLILKALENIDKIIIGIGSANITNENNPYSFEKRKKMLKEFVRQEGIEDRVLKIVSLNDVPSDSEWLIETLKKTGKIDVIVGNNDWTNGIFKNAGFKVLHMPFYKRNLYEGWRIRKLMKEGKSWQNRVPSYIISLL